MTLDWPRALAWRLRQHLLDPVGGGSVTAVVRRLGATKAEPEASAELAISLRRQRPHRGDIARSLARGEIIKTFAFRGATQLMTPDEGAAHLALRASSRMWELPSWQTYYGLTPSAWPRFREAAREALADGPLTWDELGSAITAHRSFRHLRFAFAGHAKTLLKALAWQGDLSFGPPRDGRATFQGLDRNPRWAGLPDIEEAAVRAIEIYLRAYGPATLDHIRYWLGSGLGAGGRHISSWIARLGERVVRIEIEGEAAYVLRAALDDLQGTAPTRAVRLLPAHDQWVLGPGTADRHVVPPRRRTLVSRARDLVIVGGVVSGTWSLTDDRVVIGWFAEAGRVPSAALGDEVARLGAILDRPLRPAIHSG